MQNATLQRARFSVSKIRLYGLATGRVVRRFGPWVSAALLLWAAWSSGTQVLNEIRQPESGSVPIGALHAAAAATAVLAAFAAASLNRRAPRAVLAWGTCNALLVVLLEPLGFVERADRGSMWLGAGAILLVAAALAWFVRWCLRGISASPES